MNDVRCSTSSFVLVGVLLLGVIAPVTAAETSCQFQKTETTAFEPRFGTDGALPGVATWTRPEETEGTLTWSWDSGEAPIFLGFSTEARDVPESNRRHPVTSTGTQASVDVPLSWFESQNLDDRALCVYFDEVRVAQGMVITGSTIEIPLPLPILGILAIGVVGVILIGIAISKRDQSPSEEPSPGGTIHAPAQQTAPESPPGSRSPDSGRSGAHTRQDRAEYRCWVFVDTGEGEPEPAGDEIDLRFHNRRIRLENGQCVLRTNPAKIHDDAFRVGSDRFVVGSVQRKGRQLRVTVRPSEQTLAIRVVDPEGNVPVPQAPVRLEDNSGELGEFSCDAEGRLKLATRPGRVIVRLGEAGAIRAEPQVVNVAPGDETHCTLPVTIPEPPLPDSDDLTADPPATVSYVPALADVTGQALEAFVERWRDILTDPQVNVTYGYNIADYPDHVQEVTARVREVVEQALREKQVQTHLASREAPTSETGFEWDWHLGDGDAQGLARRREALDDELTERTGAMMVRPGLRLMSLAEELISQADGRPVHASAADLTLSLVEAFLRDPTLTEEWSR